MNVLYINYTGNFAEAYKRLYLDNGKENYYGQKYSVDTVVKQARSGKTILVLLLKTNGYKKKLEENLESIGLQEKKSDKEKIKQIIDDFCPDCVILRTPNIKIFRYLRKKKIPTFPVLADSFERTGFIRGRLYNLQLSHELRNHSIKWVANHQINAALSIKNLGVPPKKILAYDWEHNSTPEDWIKKIPENIEFKIINIFYAGMISEEKGVFDLIRSIKYVINAGRKITVRLAGKGDVDFLYKLTKDLKIRDQIKFLGLIEHEKVLEEMNNSDIVVVPSRHSYPEGLPMTIMESLMVHTPVIASDHPMFVGRVGTKGSVEFFHEKDAKELAEKIMITCESIESYQNKCINAPLEWYDICLEFKWADMINKWIEDPQYCDFSKNTIEQYLI